MTDYDIYVERYAKDRNITKEEAETHLIVKSYKDYLKEREDNKNNARAF